ncbi:MAG: sugar phosphate isomerase/epimerase [Clostridia bacterium]|nr:sugar phosphate isomerase/epimerase [Clostridia bacterium]
MYNNRIGVIFNLDRLLNEGPDLLFALGLECIQLSVWDTKYSTKENAEKVKEMLGDKIAVSSVWGGWSGPQVWDFLDGPLTLGLTPPEYREKRIDDLKKHAEFAVMVGAPNLATHMGFMPEQPCYPEYRGVVNGVRHIANYCLGLGIDLNFETGQETPVTLMRVIQDVGNSNLGINLDPANLIMYGRANPVDALGIFGDRIKGVHVKDAVYPKDNFYVLGAEKVVGEGSVNFPVFLPKLLKQGYKGDLYIEREITGDQQIVDIKKTITYVKNLIATADNE